MQIEPIFSDHSPNRASAGPHRDGDWAVDDSDWMLVQQMHKPVSGKPPGGIYTNGPFP